MKSQVVMGNRKELLMFLPVGLGTQQINIDLALSSLSIQIASAIYFSIAHSGSLDEDKVKMMYSLMV
jgi:hypothetical protein